MKYLKIKRVLDLVFSFIGLVMLMPLICMIIIFIKIDSKGPVLFKQKRVGIHKSHFYVLKFRTMKVDTPNDIPTHLMENPEFYITRTGRFLRKTSLDELPQIWNIFLGEMSIIGPRPALWNQYDLIAERDKYGANDVPVGLTGWAQINGRDELPIELKAKLDGEYVKKIGLRMDIKCFFGTIISVLKKEGVVEGGTGKLKVDEIENKTESEEKADK
ncbi:MAG: lipid carrier--UDP-N-acetylgalactosaminyltransferase [Firmicutes bacterium HGW-Firmicutes-4]|nr:MAG: lipid carrier--UDP-N-acetylgalactosaminyltransferase [Firmicutes bacterium HGW-Firmicutes-4]